MFTLYINKKIYFYMICVIYMHTSPVGCCSHSAVWLEVVAIAHFHVVVQISPVVLIGTINKNKAPFN